MATPVFDKYTYALASGCLMQCYTWLATTVSISLLLIVINYLHAGLSEVYPSKLHILRERSEKFKILPVHRHKLLLPLLLLHGVIALSGVTDYGFFLSS